MSNLFEADFTEQFTERVEISSLLTSPSTRFTSSTKIFHPNLPFDEEI